MTGSTVSHYRILDKLGGGGMGQVFKAWRTRPGRPVAMHFPYAAASARAHQAAGTIALDAGPL